MNVDSTATAAYVIIRPSLFSLTLFLFRFPPTVSPGILLLETAYGYFPPPDICPWHLLPSSRPSVPQSRLGFQGWDRGYSGWGYYYGLGFNFTV